jgi:hypothetical protein
VAQRAQAKNDATEVKAESAAPDFQDHKLNYSVTASVIRMEYSPLGESEQEASQRLILVGEQEVGIT